MKRWASCALALLAIGCGTAGGPIAAPPEGAIDVPPATALAFQARAQEFYDRLIHRRFNALETFNDRFLRSHFRTEDAFFDYYARLANDLDEAHFERSRPSEARVVDFLFGAPDFLFRAPLLLLLLDPRRLFHRALARSAFRAGQAVESGGATGRDAGGGLGRALGFLHRLLGYLGQAAGGAALEGALLLDLDLHGLAAPVREALAHLSAFHGLAQLELARSGQAESLLVFGFLVLAHRLTVS